VTRDTARVFVRALTLSRLAVGAVALPLASFLDWWGLAAVVFIAAGATDMVDGALARHWRVSSDAGARLDSNADAFLTLGGMLAVAVGGAWPWWLLVVILGAYAAAMWLEKEVLEGDALGLLVLAVPFTNFTLITCIFAELLNLAAGTDVGAVLAVSVPVWAVLAVLKRHRVGDYLRYVVAKAADRNTPY
jgi:phosphatidylglycerophosphate synthase